MPLLTATTTNPKQQEASSSSWNGSSGNGGDSKPRASDGKSNDDGDDDKSNVKTHDQKEKNIDKIEQTKKKNINLDSGPRRVHNGMIEFDVEPIRSQVVCCLCEGLYREPYTTIKCFHTFCKSCIATALHSSWNTTNYNRCPRCDTYFGGQDVLSSIALPDRTLETLIDKVLFPDLAEADKHTEREFYRKRGIARRESSVLVTDIQSLERQPNQQPKKRRLNNTSTEDDKAIFQLVPDRSVAESNVSNNAKSNVVWHTAPPPLDLPFLQTQGSIRIGQLKKYLTKKLNLVNNQKLSPSRSADSQNSGISQPNKLRNDDTELEILCNSVPLGNELSVTFVSRTVWMDPTNELTLKYRYKKNHEYVAVPSTGGITGPS